METLNTKNRLNKFSYHRISRASVLFEKIGPAAEAAHPDRTDPDLFTVPAQPSDMTKLDYLVAGKRAAERALSQHGAAKPAEPVKSESVEDLPE
uniref:Uncharacterized protein n=1 Tax=Dulem virus 240 TaxID=3145717 RepID=A0AAU8AWF9_9VIRU